MNGVPPRRYTNRTSFYNTVAPYTGTPGGVRGRKRKPRNQLKNRGASIPAPIDPPSLPVHELLTNVCNRFILHHHHHRYVDVVIKH